jgi:hypothetical protein
MAISTLLAARGWSSSPCSRRASRLAMRNIRDQLRPFGVVRSIAGGEDERPVERPIQMLLEPQLQCCTREIQARLGAVTAPPDVDGFVDREDHCASPCRFDRLVASDSGFGDARDRRRHVITIGLYRAGRCLRRT